MFGDLVGDVPIESLYLVGMIVLIRAESSRYFSTGSTSTKIHHEHDYINLLHLNKQECIPVECVPPALYRKRGRGGSLSWGWSLSRGVSVRENPLPPVDRQTPVKILPCPKLRLRA